LKDCYDALVYQQQRGSELLVKRSFLDFWVSVQHPNQESSEWRLEMVILYFEEHDLKMLSLYVILAHIFNWFTGLIS